jgi:hypothetical protein
MGACAPQRCAANQHVMDFACVGCMAGEANSPGDDATAGDTTCDCGDGTTGPNEACDDHNTLPCGTCDEMCSGMGTMDCAAGTGCGSDADCMGSCVGDVCT